MEFQIPNISNKIRKLREEKSLTQEEMADLLGISQTAYGKIERGESAVSWKRLNQISTVFEKKLSEWVEIEEKSKYSINQCEIQGDGFVIQPENPIPANEKKLCEEQILLLKEQNQVVVQIV